MDKQNPAAVIFLAKQIRASLLAFWQLARWSEGIMQLGKQELVWLWAMRGVLVWAVSQLLPESLGQGSPYHNLVYWLLLPLSRALILITAKVYLVTVGLKASNSVDKKMWSGQPWPLFNTPVRLRELDEEGSVVFWWLLFLPDHSHVWDCWEWFCRAVCWAGRFGGAMMSDLSEATPPAQTRGATANQSRLLRSAPYQPLRTTGCQGR